MPLDISRHVVQARMMEAGRGRLGNQWSAPPGNAYLSIIIENDFPASMRGCISYACALAVRDMAIKLGCEPSGLKLKWPNDVLFLGQKLSGILLEVENDRLVIGIGVNVHSPPEGRACIGGNHSVATVRDCLLGCLDRYLLMLCQTGFDPIRADWLSSAWRLGEIIQIRTRAHTFSGQFQGLDQNGGLQVKLEDGTVQTIHSAEVY